MMPMELAALDLDMLGKKGAKPAKQGDAEGKLFADALFDGSALKDMGVSKEQFAALIDHAKTGKGLPHDGNKVQGELTDLFSKLGGADGEQVGQLNLLQDDVGDLGQGQDQLSGAFAQLGGSDALGGEQAAAELKQLQKHGWEIFTETKSTESDGEGKTFSADTLLLKEGAEGLGRGLVLSGKGDDAEQLQALKAEREELLQELAELKEQGLDGEDLWAALEERVAALKDAGKLEHLDVEIVSDADRLKEVSGRWQADPMSSGGTGFSSVSGIGFGGEGAERFGERSIAQSPQGEQIVRELRAGGALSASAAASGDDPAGQNANSGGSSSGGERQPSMESLLQAAEGGSRRGEETSMGRADFSSMFAAAQGLEASARSSGGVQLNVPQQVGQNGFTPAVGERIDWMVKEGVKEARLQLNPPGMGPLDVKVTVGEERTTVNIIAHNAATRDALQEDMQRLRQMLAEQGNEEVEVNISSGGEEGQQDEAGLLADASEVGADSVGEGDDGETPAQDGSARGLGLVDHFA
ncbi:flagellar hook-length control protein FliK [Halorhodospira halochloris]|uniref:flagellar hook-length control protein FliK n=1 Tax=Halorhodospira halochloris TaxID=1052 RepID=UPI001EE8BBD0|nr:flagellar hook-length control protein FliK [Halorhodospira halochloris]MCG5529993.1 flagellar hook-length control protein FliK [Halorhodospira halochloris]